MLLTTCLAQPAFQQQEGQLTWSWRSAKRVSTVSMNSVQSISMPYDAQTCDSSDTDRQLNFTQACRGTVHKQAYAKTMRHQSGLAVATLKLHAIRKPHSKGVVTALLPLDLLFIAEAWAFDLSKR